ncbi:hypothetical protein [Coxiella-like endosymbiont]|uniref:hypothetical protein n=1 Tax=Coxiella-like endosymbiont TaxID=1592897 RepID=UPI0034E22EB6
MDLNKDLAILIEIFTFSSYPARVWRITNHIVANKGHNEEENYNNTVRVFRGNTPYQGPFDKDLF